MPSDPSQAERRFAALNWVRERTFTISDPFLLENASRDAMSVASTILRDGGTVDQQIAGMVLGSGCSEPDVQGLHQRFGITVARIVAECRRVLEIEMDPCAPLGWSYRLNSLRLLAEATPEVFTVMSAAAVHRTVLSANRLVLRLQMSRDPPYKALRQHSCYQVQLLECLMRRSPGSCSITLLIESIRATRHLYQDTSVVLQSRMTSSCISNDPQRRAP